MLNRVVGLIAPLPVTGGDQDSEVLQALLVVRLPGPPFAVAHPSAVNPDPSTLDLFIGRPEPGLRQPILEDQARQESILFLIRHDGKMPPASSHLRLASCQENC